MAVKSYSGSTVRRIYTATPFKGGMVYEEMTTAEKQCKLLVNFEISSNGEYIYPRPSFVSAILHDGHYTMKLPHSIIRQTTSVGPTFLIGFDYTVDEDTFLSGQVGEPVSGLTTDLVSRFGMHVVQTGGAIESFDNSLNTFQEVVVTSVHDGDTFYGYYASDLTMEEHGRPRRRTFRLLGVDTPELLEIPEADAYLLKFGTSRRYYTVSGGTYVYDATLSSHVVTTLPGLASWHPLETYIVYLSGSYCARWYSDGTDWQLINTRPVIDGDNVDSLSYVAKANFESYLERGSVIFVETDPMSTVEDDHGRLLVYVYYQDDEGRYSSINALLLLTGCGNMAYYSPAYKYYEKFKALNDNAYLQEYGVHSLPITSLPLEDHVPKVLTAIITNMSMVAHTSFYTPAGDTVTDQTYFKKPITVKDESILTTIYDTVTYLEEPMEATELFTPSGGDIIVQILKKDYTKLEKESTVLYTDIPQQNHTWRNAISFIGRVIDNGTLVYKGIITLQYDPTNLNFYLILVNPYEVNLGEYTKLDLTSIVYNAFDPDPFVYEDLVYPDTRAAYFAYPTILAAFIYDRKITDGNAVDARVLKKFTPAQKCFIRPYLAYPNLSTTGLVGVFMRFLLNDDYKNLPDPDEYGWVQISNESDGTFSKTALESMSVTGTTLNTFDFSKTNGRPVTIEIKTVYKTSLVCTVDVGVAADLLVTDINDTFRTGVTKKYSIKIEQFGSDILAALRITLTDLYESFSEVTIIIAPASGSYINLYLPGTNQLVSARVTYQGVATEFRFTLAVNETTYNSSSKTQFIYIGPKTEYVQQDFINKEHNVFNATNVAQLDRYLLLYGSGMGNDSIQFTEFDQFGYAPFPYGQISFESVITHVHIHKGNIFVFTNSGIYILHDGLTYKDFSKTFVYGGMRLHQAEKGTVCTVGQDLYVLHDSKVYQIRKNVSVEDESDVYTVVISKAIGQILENPRKFLKERLAFGYGVILDDTSDINVTYQAFPHDNEYHLIASYHISDPVEALMVTFIYDTDNKRWRIYDTTAASHPISCMNSTNVKGYDMLCLNDPVDGFATYGTYLSSLPVSPETDQVTGDARALIRDEAGFWHLANRTGDIINPLMPIATEFDTGLLGIDPMHNKIVRRIYLTLTNIASTELTFKAIPYRDGQLLEYDFNVEAYVSSSGNIESGVAIYPSTVEFQQATGGILDGLILTDAMLSNTRQIRLDVRTHMPCKIPGCKLLIPAVDDFYITSVGIVYRQSTAR